MTTGISDFVHRTAHRIPSQMRFFHRTATGGGCTRRNPGGHGSNGSASPARRYGHGPQCRTLRQHISTSIHQCAPDCAQQTRDCAQLVVCGIAVVSCSVPWLSSRHCCCIVIVMVVAVVATAVLLVVGTASVITIAIVVSLLL